MLNVSENELSSLTPAKGSKETYSSKVENFLKSKGYEVPKISDKDMLTIKDSAILYWKEHKHNFITESSWLHAYCRLLKIDLNLSFKR